MKKLLIIVALLAGISQAQTTTTITGTLKDLTNALVTSGKVTFTLQPSKDTTISGIARFSPQQVVCLISGAGLIVAQDGSSPCVITMNTSLQPPGTYWRVDVWPYNVKTSSFTFYSVLSSYDWSTVVPTPTTSPAQNFVDVFSNQTIGGTKIFSQPIVPQGGLTGPVAINGALTATSIDGIQYASQFTGADFCAKVIAAIAALPTGGIVDARGFSVAQTCGASVSVGNASKQITLLLPPVTIAGAANPLFVVDRASALVLQTGTVIQQTGTTSNGVILAGTGPQWISGGIFGPGKILGPGSGTSTAGVILGGSTDPGNVVGNAANQTRIEGVQIAGFGTGIKFGNAVWDWTLYHAMVGGSTSPEANGIGIDVPGAVTLTGENLQIAFSNISGNVNQGLRSGSPAQTEFQIFGGSFDNDGNGTANPVISCSSANNILDTYGVHFEQNIGGPDTRNTIESAGCVLNVNGDDFTRSTNQTGSVILATGASRVHVAGATFGGLGVTTNALSLANTSTAFFAPAYFNPGAYTNDVVNAGSGAVTKSTNGSFSISNYNGIATAGQGVAPIYAATSQKAETAADTNVLTLTPPAAAGTYRINFDLSLSAANAATLGWTATWKDSNGNAQSPTNLALTQSGTAAPALTFTTSAAGNYYGRATIDVDSSATAIVIKLTFSGTSFAGKASATIERVQ